MASPQVFSGNGTKASAAGGTGRIVGVLGVADPAVSLDVKVYSGSNIKDEAQVSHVRIPAGWTQYVTVPNVPVAPADANISVVFTDSGAGHEATVYTE
jgi:hypothetical protein